MPTLSGNELKRIIVPTIYLFKMNNQLTNLFAAEKFPAEKIINWFMRHRLRINSNTKLFPNTYLGNWEGDVFEVTNSGYLYEYEVKITRADFKKDAEKAKHYWSGQIISKFDQIREGKRCNYFYYLVPENLIHVEDVPEFAGLIYVDNRYKYPEFKTIKQAPKLSSEKISEKKLLKLYESCYYRFHDYRRQLMSL